ncbi:hypothetical protein H5410_051027 [Solanum commersonii]|uniref:Uncharacterized protein n=1 Tax=Solanum commersonii TaxID=4109 RepID=A0A9J5WZR0_SOLCO|nr:hypothetical protein H5410_051027 [Solanum commersonii]
MVDCGVFVTRLDYSGGKFSLEQLTPNQFGFSRTPSCRIKHMFENLCCNGSLGAVSRDHRYSWQSAFWSISSPSCFSLQPLCILSHWAIWFNTLEQKAISWPIGNSLIGLGDLQAFISSFFSAVLFLLAKINRLPKDSSCDTPLPKILNLTILAPNLSSSSTKVNHIKLRNQMQHSHSKRITQCVLSPICLIVFSNQHLFQLTQDQKGLYKACNGVGCKGMVIQAQ